MIKHLISVKESVGRGPVPRRRTARKCGGPQVAALQGTVRIRRGLAHIGDGSARADDIRPYSSISDQTGI